tara:strand:+ start:2141 stop:2893 length:753 start_codon:yes stop_codon:yes gene_type:complete
MPPRGLKKVLKDTVPAKFCRGKWAHFEDHRGQKLKGLHNALEERVFSCGVLPSIARHGTVKRKGWKGKNGGRKRGAAVDRQLSAAVNRGKAKPAKGQYTLTKYALAALQAHKLEPVCAQRAVCDSKRRLGTAIDCLCYDEQQNRLVVIELKCGHSGSKNAAAQRDGRACKMQTPLGRAPDNTLNRHLAQLMVTRELFVNESDTLARLQTLGLNSDVGGALLYVDDENTELYPLDDWWTHKAHSVMGVLRF